MDWSKIEEDLGVTVSESVLPVAGCVLYVLTKDDASITVETFHGKATVVYSLAGVAFHTATQNTATDIRDCVRDWAESMCDRGRMVDKMRDRLIQCKERAAKKFDTCSEAIEITRAIENREEFDLDKARMVVNAATR